MAFDLTLAVVWRVWHSKELEHAPYKSEAALAQFVLMMPGHLPGGCGPCHMDRVFGDVSAHFSGPTQAFVQLTVFFVSINMTFLNDCR